MKVSRTIYVLHDPSKPKAKGACVCRTYQGALAAWATLNGTLILDDEDWPRMEGWIASAGWKVSKGKMTVEWES